VTTATRWENMPDIPTVGEFVPGYAASQWFGIGAPKNAPAAIVAKLNTEINGALERIPVEWNISGIGEIVGAFLRGEAGEDIAEGIP
jgi:hypothetical protein